MIMTPKSSIFLAASCISAIAAVGCIFELSSGTPDLGMVTTGAILALSAPICVVSFLVAVADARENQK